MAKPWSPLASRFIVPDLLVPTLEIAAGLLVVLLNLRLVGQRWNGLRPRGSESDHMHQEHDSTQHYAHDHGDGRKHVHLPPREGLRPGNLVAMGVSGG
jgi:nickel/cobalt transporter (NicO) family protein